MQFALLKTTTNIPKISKIIFCRKISTRSMIKAIRRSENSEPAFSKSKAYYGKDRIFDSSLGIPLYVPSYYDSQRFKLIRASTFILSCLALVGYVCWIREERDYDELMDMDPALALTIQKKQMLKIKKENMMSMGKDTREIDIDMLEVLAKEAELKAKLKEKKLEAKGKTVPKKKPVQSINAPLVAKVIEEIDAKKNKETKRWWWFW